MPHNVVAMRRAATPALISVLALALTVAGCTSASNTQRTVTVVNTITSGAAAPASKPLSSPVVVVSSSAAAAPSSSAPKPTPTTAKPTVAPIVKVDPLKADCAVLLDNSDVRKAIGATIGTGAKRVRLGAGGHGATGAIRCLYGSKDGKTAPVRVRLTQYSSAAAAKTQVAVDVQAAQDAGAKVSKVTVNG